MAIERFRGGMGDFFTRVAQAKRKETAENLTAAAERLQSGEDVDPIQDMTTQAQQNLGREPILLRGLRNGIDDLMTDLARQLSLIGVGLPPVEILQGLPYEISLTPSTVRGEFKLDHEIMQEIRLKLGNPQAFHIPPHPDDPEKEMTIYELDISTRARTSLRYDKLLTVNEILARTADDILALRNFGQKSMDNLLQGLYKAGVVPIEDNPVSKDQGPTI